jgi:tubulin epsilon
MIDMEEGVINSFRDEPWRSLFTEKQIITSNSGSGNNWAVGYHHYGTQFGDKIREALRQQVELCDSLQSVFLIHSLGGGTGSGLGTWILSMLSDELPDVYRFATAVVPSPEGDDVITSPYNTVLSLHQLSLHADAILPAENHALLNICKKMKLEESKNSKPFDSMNNIVARLLLDVTWYDLSHLSNCSYIYLGLNALISPNIVP